MTRSRWRSLFQKPSRRGQAAPARPTARPRLEQLEDRWVPALTYNNGALIANVQIETIYYGANWGTTAALQTEANQLDTFLNKLTDSTWMDILNQYSVTSPTAYTIGHGNLLGRDPTNPDVPTTTVAVGVNNDDDGDGDGSGDNDSDLNLDQQHQASVQESSIQNMIVSEVNNKNIPATTANTLYFVFIEPGALSQFDTVNSFGGHHRSFTNSGNTYYYAVIPLSLATTPTGSFQQSFNSLTAVASHELAEAITDPILNQGWDQGGSASQEIGDLCNGMNENYHGYNVQEEYSNAAFPAQNTGANSCIIEVDKPLDSLVVNAPANAIEGKDSGTYTVATFHDQDSTYRLSGTASDFTAKITWGDGSTGTGTVVDNGNGNFAVQANHTYNEEGSDTLSVEIDDIGGSTISGNTMVTVSDPAVMASGSKTVTATEGQDSGSQTVATFTDPGGPEALGDYSATIDWGDGKTSSGVISSDGAGNFTVSGNHTYAEESASEHTGSNPYDIKVTISHDSASDVVVHSSATVSDPAVSPTGNFAFSAVEGALSNSQTVATFTDPGGPEALADYSADIAWGDGQSTIGATITFDGSSTFTVSGAHTYGEEGTDTITVTIRHEGATDAQTTSTATVSDPAVVATPVKVFAVECLNNTVTVATFTDPGGPEPNSSDPNGTLNDHYKIDSIDWGDGTALDTSSGTISFDGTSTYTVQGTHAYQHEGSYNITVIINHEGVKTTVKTTATIKDDIGLLLLDSTGSQSLQVNGNGVVDVTGCGAAVVDSNNGTAALVSGHGSVTAEDIDVTGGAKTTNSGTFSTTIDHETATADPLGLGLPTPPSATFSAVNYSGSAPMTLNAGTYNGGIKISGSGTVTLNSGVYYMKGGGFSVSGQATVTGNNVIIINAPASATDTISISSQAHVTLSAITTGPDKGIVILQDPASTNAVNFTGQSAVISLTGVVYVPSALVQISGNAVVTINPGPGTAVSPPPILGALIAYDLHVGTNGVLTINPDPGSGVSPSAARAISGGGTSAPISASLLTSAGQPAKGSSLSPSSAGLPSSTTLAATNSALPYFFNTGSAAVALSGAADSVPSDSWPAELKPLL
jgi:hypothetical protein